MHAKKWQMVAAAALLLFFSLSGVGMAVHAPAHYRWESHLMSLIERAVRKGLPEVHDLKINEVRSLSTVAARIPADVRNPSFAVQSLGNWNRKQGKVMIRLMVSLPGGKTSRCWLNVFISGKCEAVVAKRALERGSPVRWQDVAVCLLDAGKVDENCLVDFPRTAVFEAVRKIDAGQPLTVASIRPYRLVKRGEMVTVVLQRRGIRIVTKGTAMANGSLNEVIMVKNPVSRRLYQAQVVDAGQVRVVY